MVETNVRFKEVYVLNIVGKLCGKIVIERVLKITVSRIIKGQGGLRKGWGCVD